MKITHWLSVAALFAIAGCEGEGITRPPPTDVLVFNAAPNVEQITFRRENDVNTQLTLSYGGGASNRWDSGPYEFNLDYPVVGSVVRAVTFSETLSPDLDYVFVAVSPGGQPEVLTFARDNRAGNAAEARITFIHAFDGLGPVDVYFEAPGTMLGSTAPRGTVSFAGDALSFEIPDATYRVYLTTPGDRDDVLFESTNQGIANSPDLVYVVSDPAGQGSADIVVSRVGQVTVRLGQIGLDSSVRFVHGLNDRMDRDVYLDDTMSGPVFPAQAFGVLSEYADVDLGPHSFIVTPLGNPGTEELSVEETIRSGGLYTILVSNTSDGEIAAQRILEDKRSMTGQATLTLLNAAGLFEVVGVYVEAPGTDITNEGALVNLLPPGFAPRQALLPGDYEITIENPLTGAILAGPVPVTLDDGGVYGLLIVNGAGGSTVDLVLYDDFIP